VAKESFLLPGAEKETVLDVSTRNLRGAKVVDQTSHRVVPIKLERSAYQFPIEGGHYYTIEEK
jgi:hypothetical protein